MLLEFGAKFVDPKQRQLSLQAFAEVNKVSLQYPRVKIAMLMRAYRKPPNRTWCPPPEPAWNQQAKTYAMSKLETMLHYFQSTCKPAVAGMLPIHELGLMSNVSIAAADAFVLCKERGQEGEGMVAAAAKFFEQIKTFAANSNPGHPRGPNNPG